GPIFVTTRCTHQHRDHAPVGPTFVTATGASSGDHTQTNLTDTQTWTAWLRTQARFHSYSFGNCVLIALQRQDATRVAGFAAWTELGRTVRKGEKAIWILAPMTRRRTDATGSDQVEQATGDAAGPEAKG